MLVVLLLFFAGAVVLLAVWVAITYNGLVRLRNQVENAWSQIDVQLKRRHDLIPNLVETVKGYAAHERATLENVIRARNMAIAAKTVGERAEAENFLTGTLKSLFAVAEAYPNLKADQNFLRLQEELTSTENKVAFARQFYNDSVMMFNTRRETFPTNVVANLFNFARREFFEVKEAGQREAPQVKF
ncbi:MAG: LemA family protein [Verrucomicrobiae bacterium]|nr:LemA family protein [Verrucomicrobiae bacterium]